MENESKINYMVLSKKFVNGSLEKYLEKKNLNDDIKFKCCR